MAMASGRPLSEVRQHDISLELAADPLRGLQNRVWYGAMNNFAAYLTPEQAFKQYQESNPDGSPFTLEELREMAKDTSTCENCDNPVWRMVGLGLCFSCTTGEADASEDYELELIR